MMIRAATGALCLAALFAAASASANDTAPPSMEPSMEPTTFDELGWMDDSQALPPMVINTSVPFVEPTVWPHLHPSHQHFQNAYIWSEMLAAANDSAVDGDLVHNLTKDFVSNITQRYNSSRTRRSVSLRTFESDLLNAFLKYSGIKQSNLYHCVDGLYKTAKDIYHLVLAHSSPSVSSILSVVKEAVNTILSCLQFAAEHSSFFGEIYSSVSGVLHDIVYADTIMQDCGKVVSMIRSKHISWWTLGKDIAQCYKDVSRRARRNLVAPASWTCHASWYNDTAICDSGCGATDPDCTIAHRLSIVTKPDHVATPHAPLSWVCAPIFYAAGDGCDKGCGTEDPDCNDPNATVHTWPGRTAFGTEYTRLVNKLDAGASISDSCNAHFEDEDPIGCTPTSLQAGNSNNNDSNGGGGVSVAVVAVVCSLLACAVGLNVVLALRLKRAEKNPAKYLTRTTANPYSSGSSA